MIAGEGEKITSEIEPIISVPWIHSQLMLK